MASFPYEVMWEKSDALERMELRIQWGQYDIHVLRFHLTQFQPGRPVGFHKHAEYEFHFIPRGKGKVIIVDQVFALKQGSLYLTGPEVMHYQEADANEAMDELCLHVDIIDRLEQADASSASHYDDWEATEARNCIEKLRAIPLRTAVDNHKAMPCFLEAYQANQQNFIGSYTTIKQLVIQILLRTVRAYDPVNEQNQFPTRDMKAYRYRLALEYIQANYTGAISLEDVAEKLGVSTRHLQRLFKQLHHGQTFTSMLEDIRLQAVCRELQETTQSIEHIAKLTGFNSGNYLHTVFRKKYGITPSEYRASN